MNLMNDYRTNRILLILSCITGWLLFTQPVTASVKDIVRFPANKARKVNVDTHLELTFKSAPVLGSSGQIRIYDAKDNRLVDMLDISIPAGPTSGDTTKGADYTPVPYDYTPGHFTNANTKPGTPSGLALPTSDKFQLTIIGGFTDGFHFYPIIIHGNKATIYPHNNLLEYGKSYYIQIDPGVLSLPDGSFNGYKGKEWRFATKAKPPRPNTKRLVVNTNGSGNFNTVQGAIDFIPDNNTDRFTVYVENGTYEEIVYFRNKTNITIIGESRKGVVIKYANNEVFNPHPINLKTNEMPGTFPSRRAAFAVDHCRGIHLVNLTIKTTAKGQAEGLLINGEEIIVSHVTIVGSGDALQTNGTAYYTACNIIGDGDTVLGRGAAFFINCEFYSVGTFMWIRNTETNHGNVFVHCNFITLGGGETEIARSPVNHGKNYPYCEAVLINCSLSGISPVGWGPIDGETANIHFWEYNSTFLNSTKLVDVSKRHPASYQLSKDKDAEILSKYKNPAYVLGGWVPDDKFLEQYNLNPQSLKIH